ncbi:hypothetical protein MNBD_GAMMA05-2319 [hydrothermal vent metagenome]|uniref:Uncharacterized protein n=1 Tax=hydrothermal vent metagenome TaxID=652676 RepID=A0A3B0WQ34_9ZZZZ
MLATLAIINLAIAGTLINNTIDERGTQLEPTTVVSIADTTERSTDYVSWAEE